ncbi:flavin reductase family protein [Arthrobacter sp. CJ23]|uniref:flavin reductase family protein n=1 Tax=Arthrobacter sp. CJ23 TaxID=2972479 RepID=UPI00215C2FE3|nr:flavin reductase family protein [Arthrobacter sp. CJ23]UVJ39330.1 flavin reductase family protein [Arthrobacter sp. CJ23]
MTQATVDGSASIKAAFSQFPSGVAAFSAMVDFVPEALVASSFTVGVSLDPPLVMFAVQNSSTTWPKLRQAPRLGISVLAEGQEAACLQLSSKRGDRFAGLDTSVSDTGAVLIDGAVLGFECEIVSETPAGDHAIVVLEVKSTAINHGSKPLVYHGAAFRQLAA